MSKRKPVAPSDPDITIRALVPEDWEIFREIRLHAVTMHTGYFLSSVEETKQYPPEHWKQSLSGGDKQVFGLFSNGKLIGITGVFTWKEDPTRKTGIMAMSFIEPEYRGRGYSSLFYKARLDFAKNHKPWTKLAVAHRDGNDASKHAILKHGFVYKGAEEITWPDGKKDLKHQYELNLDVLSTLKSI